MAWLKVPCPPWKGTVREEKGCNVHYTLGMAWQLRLGECNLPMAMGLGAVGIITGKYFEIEAASKLPLVLRATSSHISQLAIARTRQNVHSMCSFPVSRKERQNRQPLRY
jgi:tRNA U34 2-thiouridine synthase MnmA/TrmU